MPLLSSQWTTQGPSISVSHGPAMGGMAEVDLRMFQQDHPAHYAPAVSYSNNSQILSPSHIGYVSDTAWPSDVDMATPSTAGFPADIPDGFLPSLRMHTQAGNATQSPHSSIDEFSPHSTRASHADASRPGIARSITAPDHQPLSHVSHRRTATDLIGYGDLNGTAIKPSDASEDGDEDFVPGGDESSKAGTHHRASTSSAPSTTNMSVSNRGRKRQRIPHTAVERRYRENLNAHLDKLRQTVPAFNQTAISHGGVRSDEIIVGAAGGDGGSTVGAGTAGGMRPSKCEVLNGAIEHIVSLDKENGVLKAENKALRQRLDEVEQWYHSQQHSGPSGALNR